MQPMFSSPGANTTTSSFTTTTLALLYFSFWVESSNPVGICVRKIHFDNFHSLVGVAMYLLGARLHGQRVEGTKSFL
jgi:hypothetical protein